MKKTITIGAILLSTVAMSFAMDTLEVTKINYALGRTEVTYKRMSDEREMFTQVKSFLGSISAQEAVNKGSYGVDSSIFSMTKLASTTGRFGQVDSFATLRYEAYQTKGLAGYFVELARQNGLSI